MKQIMAAAAAASGIFAANSPAHARGIVHDAVALNIGVNCEWQSNCMKQQRGAMRKSLGYVAVAHPAEWKIQLCNRNANRGGYRVDWVGFDHCIRNSALARPSRSRAHPRARSSRRSPARDE